MNSYRKSLFIGILTVLLSIPFLTAGNARADDPYEENDTLETAWPVEYNWARTWLSGIYGLGIQADDDWYRIDVDPAAERIQVDCRFTHAQGDIDIELYDSTGELVPTEGGGSTTDDELIDVAISGGGTYYIKVFYWDPLISGTGNTYDLRWDDFTEDAYEENDDWGTAWHPGFNWERTWLSNIDGLGIQADDDWYRIDVDPGAERIQVNCQFTHAEGDIDLDLYDSVGTYLTGSNSATDNEFIDHAISSGGTYYIRVYKGNGRNAYDLWWDDKSEDAYEENDDWGTAWHPGYNWVRKWLSDIDGLGIQADEDWYRIDVDPGADRIQVDCQFTHAEGDIDVELYDSSGTFLHLSDSVNDNEFIEHAILGGGTFYIRVYCVAGDTGNAYDLWWDDFSTGSTALISGLGETSGGWVEAFAEGYSHGDWLRVGWKSYNSVNGEARIAVGDINGDGRDEIVLGLGPVPVDPSIPYGWFQVLDDDYNHLAWGRVNWKSYNSANGESWPVCGDVDGDNRDEIVVGLGSGGGGYLEVFDYDAGSITHKDWVRVNWKGYNSGNGEARPSCGDVDGDGRDEIVVGLGGGGGGYLEVLDDALAGYAHMAWARIQWKSYNSANGEARPSCGDVDADGRDEIVVGLGGGGGGYFEVFDDALGGYAHVAWSRVQWKSYNSANGESRPVCGDVDADGRDEIVVGLGGGGGGYFEVFDDAIAGYGHMAWARVQWRSYNSANGATWPAVMK